MLGCTPSDLTCPGSFNNETSFSKSFKALLHTGQNSAIEQVNIEVPIKEYNERKALRRCNCNANQGEELMTPWKNWVERNIARSETFT